MANSSGNINGFVPASRAARTTKAIKAAAVLGFVAIAGVFAAGSLSPNVSGAAVEAVTMNTTSSSGAELYAASCARCHGADGKGGKGPNLASEKRQAKWRDSDEKLIKKITNGGMFMPSFGKKLKPEEIKAIAGHVRSLKE